MNTDELFEILKEMAEAVKPGLPAGFTAVALADITGPDPAQWSLTASDGRLDLAKGPPTVPPDITVTLAAETAAGLYLKTVHPMAAFLTGRIKVKGDPSKITLIKQILTRK